MSTLNIRYIVADVDAAIPFYEALGFKLAVHDAPGFARLTRGGVALLLNVPGHGGAGSDAAGETPTPGGWNRFQLVVKDIEREMERLGAAGIVFKNGIVEGNAGRQALAEDPSGNLVELLQPRK